VPPWDYQALTVPRVIENLHSVNRSKFLEQKVFDELCPKFMSFGLGLQVKHCLVSLTWGFIFSIQAIHKVLQFQYVHPNILQQGAHQLENHFN